MKTVYRMVVLFLLVCGLGWLDQGLAQAAFSGKVEGTKTGAAIIIGKNIWLEVGNTGLDTVKSNSGVRGQIWLKTRTDGEGNFSVTLPAGTYELIVWERGMTPQSDTINVPGAGYVAGLTRANPSFYHSSLSFAAEERKAAGAPPTPPPAVQLAIEGTVTGPKNGVTIIVGKNIWLEVGNTGEDKIRSNTGSRGVIVARVRTNQTGQFSIPVRAGTYEVIFWERGSTPQSETVTVPGPALNVGLTRANPSFYHANLALAVEGSPASGGNPPAANPEPEKRTEPPQSPTGKVTNLALRKAATQSSIYYGTGIDQSAACGVDGVIAPDKDPHNMFHTRLDSPAWWQVDLGQVSQLARIKLHNRQNCADRAKTIQVMLSTDGQRWETVYSHNGTVWDVLNLNVSGKTARFVKLQLREPNYFHLFEVEVWGTP
ncbi:MAG: discoidin domain-containing protein [Blastocatellia bacterium]|nr:discoidin domain-containing protein [Blastocatellia bacterium]